MTEKRFTFTQDTLAKADVFDGNEFVCCTLSVWVEQLVDLLNELAEENKEIKIQYDNLKAQRDEFYHGARENANRVGQLEKENKELREQLKDCTEKAKEEIRKQAENEAIRWANIGR